MKQGDPISPLMFNIGINQALQSVIDVNENCNVLTPLKYLAHELQEFSIRSRINQLLTATNCKKLRISNQFASSKCPFCINQNWNLSHILNGCKKYNGLYLERHNSIIEIIKKYSTIAFLENKAPPFGNSMLRPDLQYLDYTKITANYIDGNGALVNCLLH